MSAEEEGGVLHYEGRRPQIPAGKQGAQRKGQRGDHDALQQNRGEPAAAEEDGAEPNAAHHVPHQAAPEQPGRRGQRPQPDRWRRLSVADAVPNSEPAPVVPTKSKPDRQQCRVPIWPRGRHHVRRQLGIVHRQEPVAATASDVMFR